MIEMSDQLESVSNEVWEQELMEEREEDQVMKRCRKWIITGGSFLTVTIPLLLAMGLSSKDEKSGLSLKLLSWVIVFIEIGANLNP